VTRICSTRRILISLPTSASKHTDPAHRTRSTAARPTTSRTSRTRSTPRVRTPRLPRPSNSETGGRTRPARSTSTTWIQTNHPRRTRRTPKPKTNLHLRREGRGRRMALTNIRTPRTEVLVNDVRRGFDAACVVDLCQPCQPRLDEPPLAPHVGLVFQQMFLFGPHRTWTNETHVVPAGSTNYVVFRRDLFDG